MNGTSPSLEKLQRLVLDICAVERSHRLPGLGRAENVVEHSFSIAMLSWILFDTVRPPLDPLKISRYALVHDFAERGYKIDVNTFASPQEREEKKRRESVEAQKIIEEFADFNSMAAALEEYESMAYEEALFVWSVDKLQAIILGGNIDGWWPYKQVGVTYDQFCKKMDEVMGRCSPYLRDIFADLVEESKKTYYDRPAK